MLLTDITQGKVKISPTSILLYINLISDNSEIILKIGSYSFESIKIVLLFSFAFLLNTKIHTVCTLIMFLFSCYSIFIRILIQGCETSVLRAQNVQDIVKCEECGKHWCIHATRVLTAREARELKKVIRKYDYVCGCLITPDVSMLSGYVFTRLEMHCKTPIKWKYYGTTKITARKHLCCHCSKQEAQHNQEFKKLLKTVLPICDGCRAESKKVYKRGPIKTAAANQKRKENS